MRALQVVALSALLVAMPLRAAHASDAGAADDASASAAAREEEMARLEAQIARDATELSTGDCLIACRALASMRRSVERLCELAPGARCGAARAKLRAAEERVRASCAECPGEEGSAPVRAADEPAGEAPGKKQEAPRAEAPETAPKEKEEPEPTAAPARGAAAEPPAEAAPRRGGCAGCATRDGASAPDPWLLAAITALFASRLRARDRRRTRP